MLFFTRTPEDARTQLRSDATAENHIPKRHRIEERRGAWFTAADRRAAEPHRAIAFAAPQHAK